MGCGGENLARTRTEEEDEAEDTISELMSQTMSSLKLVRSKQVRKLFPKMSSQFESDLEDEWNSNPYSPSDDGNSYQDPDAPRTSITAAATLPLVNAMRRRQGLAPAKLKRTK